MATYEKVSWFQRLKKDMKGMTFKEKLGHLWEYYKWFAITAVVLIIATVSIVTSVIENRKELVYGGAVVNVGITEEGSAYLKEGWFEAQNGNPKKQRIKLETMMISSLITGTYNETSDVYLSKLSGMVSIGEIDYVLTDVDAVCRLSDKGIVSSLDTVFTQEQLELLAYEKFTYQTETESYWIAIDITDLPFVQKHISLNEDGQENRVCIAFPGNTGREEKNLAFLEYLSNWSE